MSITLSYQNTTVELHPDLYWSDESAWKPVEQTVQRTITGALILQVAGRTGGRPITLQPEDESSAWVTRSVVDQLGNWAEVPGRTLVLTLRGTSRNVVFRHQDGNVLEAVPVVHFSDVQQADWYRLTVRLMEI